MQHSPAPGGPAAGNRSGRRPLVERNRLRSTLERSTGLTPQALSHLPGLVVAVLDLDYVVIEVSSTVESLGPNWAAELKDQPFLDRVRPAEASLMRSELDRAARGETVSWRYEDATGITYETEVAPITDSFTSAVVGLVLIARDVSDKAAAERARTAVMQSFQDSFQLAPIPQVMLDGDGAVKAVNAAFAALLGHPPDALCGTKLRDLVLPRDLAGVDRAVRLTHRNPTGPLAGTRQDAGARMLRADGQSVHCQLHLIGLADETLGASTIVQLLDQTERDRYEADLRQVANHDSLTGLLNRRGFRERVADSLSAGRRRNEARTLLLIDVDHFKTINDLHGHAVGDTMLRDVADQIRAVIDPRDPASRIAGDEFAVLCVDGPTSARASAEALLELVRGRAADARAAGRPPLTVSVGIAEVDPVMDSVDDVLMRADLALYEAKEWGRDCIVEASAGIAGGAARRADHVLQALRQAIATNGFLLHAQPILDLTSGKVTQHEMLARLQGDDGATLAPG
ncbi:MAG: diguanylate cyclase, partial [Solirubrobacteraceae bacterium]|nr:diguanylate cyclase [Solirubrobacteraceae bacterium]